MNTETTNDRGDMRAMLAEIVLAIDLPVPTHVGFLEDSGILNLRLSTLAGGKAWSRHLGGRTEASVNRLDGNRYLDHGVITWHGWSVLLSAHEPAGAQGEPLPADTTARLTELANT